MTKGTDVRELALGVLLEVEGGAEYSHIALRNVLEKYQYLEKTGAGLSDPACGGNAGAAALAGLRDRSDIQRKSKEAEAGDPGDPAPVCVPAGLYGQRAGMRRSAMRL